MDPATTLTDGCRILDPVLQPHGFHFELREVGKGSGGHFAWGEYVKGDRRLEIHFRYSPGHITYHFGERSISHKAYRWSVLGKAGGNRYPRFSDDPMQHFRDLASDLENRAWEFVRGTDDDLSRRFDDALAHPRPTGFKRIWEPESST